MKRHVIADTMVLSRLASLRLLEILPALYGTPVLVPKEVVTELGNPESPSGAGRALAGYLPGWLEIRNPVSRGDARLQRKFPSILFDGKREADGPIIALAQELSEDGTPVLILSNDDKVLQVVNEVLNHERQRVDVAGYAEIFCASFERGLTKAPGKILGMMKEQGYYTPGVEELNLVADFEHAHHSRTIATQSQSPRSQPLAPTVTTPAAACGSEPQRAELEAQQWRERERQELERRQRSRDRKPSFDRDIG